MEPTAIDVFTAAGVLLVNVWLWILNGKFDSADRQHRPVQLPRRVR